MNFYFSILVVMMVGTCIAVTNATKPNYRISYGCKYKGKFFRHGQRFPAQDGCNKCICKGSRVLCTKIACPKTCEQNGVSYNSGDTFPSEDGCNTCKCTASGTVVCTLKACGCELNGVFHKVGETFPAGDGCNTCTCTTPGVTACTEIACGCRSNGDFYEVGQTFPSDDGCNTCTCTSTGLIACTRIACLCPVRGQVFTRCGSACPPSCITPNPICTRQCVARCECPRETVINEITNTCVPVDECPTQCPPDKPTVNCFVNPCRFARCPSRPDAKCVADFCGGCNARFFDPKGNEITNSCNCPIQGQLFTFCGSACPPNCTTPNPICTRQCVARCECPRGTVINNISKTCVPVNECPSTQCPPDKPTVNCFVNPCRFAKCTSHPDAKCVADFCGGCNARFFDARGNEVNCSCPIRGQIFNRCGSACPPNCTTPSPICTRQCVPRCECPRGTVINEITRSCVPVDECHPSHCPSHCPPDKPLVNCLVNPCRFAKCTSRPDAKLKCKADFCGGCNARFFDARGNEVNCSCPIKGQVFTRCGSACPPNCTTPNPICTRQCVARCECPRGTVINEITKTCVPVDECPTQCPPDKPTVNCLVNPCRFARCTSRPDAKCVADFCGGCNARFFFKGIEVNCSCPVKGQIFNKCGSACLSTCTNPIPTCTLQCVPRCECPKRTVLNQITRRCIPVEHCPTKSQYHQSPPSSN